MEDSATPQDAIIGIEHSPEKDIFSKSADRDMLGPEEREATNAPSDERSIEGEPHDSSREPSPVAVDSTKEKEDEEVESDVEHEANRTETIEEEGGENAICQAKESNVGEIVQSFSPPPLMDVATHRPSISRANVFQSTSTLNTSYGYDDDEDDSLPAIFKAPAFDEGDGSVSVQSILSKSYDQSIHEADKSGIDPPTPASCLLEATMKLQTQVTEALKDVSLEVRSSNMLKSPLSVLKCHKGDHYEQDSNDIDNIGASIEGLISPIPAHCGASLSQPNTNTEREFHFSPLPDAGSRLANIKQESAATTGNETEDNGMVDENNEPDCGVDADAAINAEDFVQQDSDNGNKAADTLNDSFASTGSQQEVIQQLNASSQAFFHRLKGAAFRRKMNLTKSRDSLVAKEKVHREELEQEQLRREEHEAIEIEFDVEPPPIPPSDSRVFKARPVPASVGTKGNGGLSGVPKIDKKPTTTPFSPLLGARRRLGRLSNAFGKADKSNEQLPDESQLDTGFRARPLPQSSGAKGHAGQSGIPKVPKRPITMPFSPLLGVRRKPKAPESESCANLSSSSLPPAPLQDVSGQSGPSLAGLSLLNDENQVQSITPKAVLSTSFPGYVPHSTKRAQDRAAFDVLRKEASEVRIEKEQSQRRATVKKIGKELRSLRASLS